MRSTKILASIAYVAMVGTSSLAVFAATLTADATPIRAETTKVTFYADSDIADILGFQKDAKEPSVDLSAAFDPRLFESEDAAYAIVDKKAVGLMTDNWTGQIGIADSDTKFDARSYGLVMIGAETLKSEPQYAELIDRVIDNESVLVVVVGHKARELLLSGGIDEDKIIVGDSAQDVLHTFAEFTLGLDELQTTVDETATIGSEAARLESETA